ncbi:amidohydrolase family protein [Paenibacillus eucommiae]|uniref:TIM-barrel fold metal-dependent hydrolase n=1 Tax=Paenibacillus eucommiae TaxID=1355755 RepID=A0ABS4ILI4_9BACL|nr:amidohydrolase family protein [Paenibacillus eucommiae]MBP1988425.1 putative TIM-barrel fold metal-dependent hydrolase [Paenibacillus eucommiae]
MIIDAHNHPDWYGYDVEKFLQNMEQYQIDKTWLLSWESPKDEYNPSYNRVVPDHDGNGPISFQRCVAYVKQHPDKFVLGYAPDPRRPDAIDRLKAAIDLYGVRIYGEIKLRMMYDNPDAIRLFRFCGEQGLPVVVHIDYEFDSGQQYPRPNWWYGGGIDAFERAVKACPDTKFLGHAPGFWAHISGDDQYETVAYPVGKVEPGGKVAAMLRQYPNLYCDISAGSGHNALNRDHDYTREFIEEFQDRIVYARDYFDNIHQVLLNSLNLPEHILAKIYAENALKLVPLAGIK